MNRLPSDSHVLSKPSCKLPAEQKGFSSKMVPVGPEVTMKTKQKSDCGASTASGNMNVQGYAAFILNG